MPCVQSLGRVGGIDWGKVWFCSHSVTHINWLYMFSLLFRKLLPSLQVFIFQSFFFLHLFFLINSLDCLKTLLCSFLFFKKNYQVSNSHNERLGKVQPCFTVSDLKFMMISKFLPLEPYHGLVFILLFFKCALSKYVWRGVCFDLVSDW